MLLLLLVSTAAVASRRLLSAVPTLRLAVAALGLSITTRTALTTMTALVITAMLLRGSTVRTWLLLSSITALLRSTVRLLSVRVVATRRVVGSRLRTKALRCGARVRARLVTEFLGC